MTMSRGGLAALLSAVVLSLAPRVGWALPFSSSVQRYEADGNAYGSADGVFDLVDEFDDGLLAPNWAILLGTAIESGGVLTLRDPGVNVSFVGLPQEISTVESTEELANGLGNFVITTYWDPAPLGTNRQFFFQLYGTNPVIEATGLTVSNLDAEGAAGGGLPVGYSVQFSRVFPLGNQEPPVAHVVPIDFGSVSGAFALRLTFDDATDLMTASFSLDGGATFQSPFPAIQAFKLAPDGELLIGAAAIPTNGPPPACPYVIQPAKVKFQRIDAPPGEQKFRMSGHAHIPLGVPPFIDPPSEGLMLAATTGAGLTQPIIVPGGGAPPNAGCGPKDGWSQHGLSYTYKNFTNLLPPGCTTSAYGLRKVKFIDSRARNGLIKFSVVAGPTAFLTGGSPPPTATIQIGDPFGQTACATTIGLACTASPKVVTCK